MIFRIFHSEIAQQLPSLNSHGFLSNPASIAGFPLSDGHFQWKVFVYLLAVKGSVPCSEGAGHRNFYFEEILVGLEQRGGLTLDFDWNLCSW